MKSNPKHRPFASELLSHPAIKCTYLSDDEEEPVTNEEKEEESIGKTYDNSNSKNSKEGDSKGSGSNEELKLKKKKKFGFFKRVTSKRNHKMEIKKMNNMIEDVFGSLFIRNKEKNEVLKKEAINKDQRKNGLGEEVIGDAAKPVRRVESKGKVSKAKVSKGFKNLFGLARKSSSD